MEVKTIKSDPIQYFKEISNIPRCSGNEQAISDYLKKFGEDLGLEVIQDKSLNIVIRKPASPGYENSPGVILQGHMDMVCEKSMDSHHDFASDSIKVIEKDGYLCGDGTTLGADDGIAIAMGMAILADNTLNHPRMELFVTTSEETDMSGALSISDDLLKGNLLINIDSEEEGILTVGSAGGVTILGRHDIQLEENSKKSYKISFSGLMGGHSGMQIHENRGNILKVMADFLHVLSQNSEYRLAGFTAGTLDNAIPRSGELIITTEDDNQIEESIKTTKKNFTDIQGNLNIEAQEIENVKTTWTDDMTKDIVNMIREMPTGVNTFMENSEIVESSNNLASIKEKDGVIYLENSVRSSNDKIKNQLVETCVKVFEDNKFRCELDMEYPGWEFSKESVLRDLAENLYREMYGKDFETIVVHAGLECGAISSKYPNMDMISIGPNITGAHTPKENMEVASATRVFEFIVELISRIK